MTGISINVSNIDLALLERRAQARGQTSTAIIAEWTRTLCEYPDEAMRVLARLVHQLPPAQVDDKADDDLDGLRRRAGVRRRQRRTTRPTVTVTRLEDPGRNNSGVDGAAGSGAGGMATGSAGASTVGASGVTTNGSGT